MSVAEEDLLRKPRAEAAAICCQAALAEIEEAERPGGMTVVDGRVSFESFSIAERVAHVAKATRHLSTAIGFLSEALSREPEQP